MDRRTLIRLADAHIRQVSALLHEVESRDHGARRAAATAGRLAGLERAAGLVSAYVRRIGLDPGAAARAVAACTDYPADALLDRWRRRAGRIEEAELVERTLIVMQLAGRGFTNAQIAGLVGLAPGSVGRIVRRQLNAAADVRRPRPAWLEPPPWRRPAAPPVYRPRLVKGDRHEAAAAPDAHRTGGLPVAARPAR